MMAILKSTSVVRNRFHRILSLHVISIVVTSLVSSIFLVRVNEMFIWTETRISSVSINHLR